MANESATRLKFPFTEASGEESWAQELFDGAHLPLRFSGLETDGAESHRVEITKLDRKILPARLFEMPRIIAGWT